MSALSQLKAINIGANRIHDWSLRLFWLVTWIIFGYNWWGNNLWAGIGYAVLFFVISFALIFVFVGLIMGAIVERKIRKCFPVLLSEYGLKPNLSYVWHGRNILAVDTENKKVFYSVWGNLYDPIILSFSDIVSVKVLGESGSEAKIKIDGDKFKKIVITKFALEIQYKNNEGVVKKLLIPYENERLKAEEMGRTIGLM